MRPPVRLEKKPAKACGGAVCNVESSLFENAEFNKATAEIANELMGESDSSSDLFDRKREVAAFFNLRLARKAAGDPKQVTLCFAVESIERLAFAV
jgi:hypothetical protein